MVNYVSCLSFGIRHSPAVKVLHAGNGHISEFHDSSMKAAELMLENPNYFVIHSACLHTGQGVSPLSADEELKPAHVYILLPMQKLHSRLSVEEKAALSGILAKSSRSGKASKHAHSNKVTPVGSSDPQGVDQETVGGEERATPLTLLRTQSFQLGSIAELSMEMGSQGAPKMRSKQWMPKLETINESSILKV